MAQSKIKSVEKNIVNSVHNSWGDKPYFEYNIEMENGDNGIVSGVSSDKYTYDVGQLVTYNLVPNEKYGNKIRGVKLVKDAGGQGGSGRSSGSFYDDPAYQLRKCKASAYMVAAAYLAEVDQTKVEKSHLNVLYKKFTAWLTKVIPDTSKVFDRIIALEISQKLMNIPAMSISDNDSMLAMAEEIYHEITKSDEEPTV